jgi:SAM-dependent methyltransferase
MKNSINSAKPKCPGCRSDKITNFYRVEEVPVNSVLLLPTEEEALSFPKGKLELGFCNDCGFIHNQAFDPGLLEYSSRYESTQGFSPTFNSYQHHLAETLIERYNVRNKNIIEIGCGQGEFITLLCELGGNRGIGFDPVFDPNRKPETSASNITFVRDFYSEKYPNIKADLVCCKMTLEHIPQTADFVSMIRRTMGDQPNALVFFQVPDVVRIFQELAFWDMYYEHCSYFSPGSLARLFRSCGFEIVDLERNYGDQYLILTAKPSVSISTPHALEENLSSLSQLVNDFVTNYQSKLDEWQKILNEQVNQGRKVVVWGASSKTVAFFSTLHINQEIRYAVDINPNKHGTYIAGTGQKIVSPDFLREYQPDLVIVMNPIYRDEIRKALDDIGVRSRLMMA